MIFISLWCNIGIHCENVQFKKTGYENNKQQWIRSWEMILKSCSNHNLCQSQLAGHCVCILLCVFYRKLKELSFRGVYCYRFFLDYIFSRSKHSLFVQTQSQLGSFKLFINLKVCEQLYNRPICFATDFVVIIYNYETLNKWCKIPRS